MIVGRFSSPLPAWNPSAILGVLVFAVSAPAQPTYQLSVKPHLKPLATLRLEGERIRRSAIQEDPGFRLQFHFKKDGKTAAIIEARANPTVDVPQKEAGTYTVALELFYPAYKGGTAQKGEFKPISEVLTYRVEPGPPLKITFIEPPKPLLVIQCGKGNGKQQDERITQGYGYQLLQGSVFDGWPKTAGATHCWQDAKLVRLALTLPPGTAGTLRLLFVEGDSVARKQRVTVQGKAVGDLANFGVLGKRVEVPVTAADAKDGKLEVTLQNLAATGTAVVSVVEFVPSPIPPR
jgi:hypothetical protein